MRIWLLTLVLLGSMACDEDQVPTGPTPTGAPVIVAFGDSLTEGPGLDRSQAYPALLQQRLAEQGLPHAIVNAGVSGDTTTSALRRFEAALVPGTAVLILALGANDGLRGVPVSTVEENLDTMVSTARGRGIAVLLCRMEAPPVDGLGYSVAFHLMFDRLAQKHEVTLVPFFLTGIIGNDELHLNDTLHPNAAGHRIIAETIWPHLLATLRAL